MTSITRGLLFKLSKAKFSYFTVTRKDTEVLYRIDKLNIFEYFRMYKRRINARPLDCLLKELTLYFQSSEFDDEFKRILNTDLKKFRFYNLHLSLLSERLKNISRIADWKTAIRIKLLCFKLDHCFIKFYSEEALCYYIHKEYKIADDDFLLENELISLLSKDQVGFFKVRKNFVNFLSNYLLLEMKINEEGDKFKGIVLKKYLLPSEDKMIEFTCDKLRTYFIAHSNYLSTLSYEDLFKNKIYWGLNELKLINH